MVKKKFYITTAIDYPNAEPHIGHAYQKIIADVLARWNKINGNDVWFLTGTDEHGKKIQEAAEKAGKKPRDFVDELSGKFKEAWKALNIDYSRFIRTTDKDHEKLVQDVIKKCDKKGDIYKGSYEGLYCIGCETFYTEKDLVDGKCPLHNRLCENIKEESYFFRLSNYQKFLLDLYEKHPEFVLPSERRNEMINRVKDGLKDLSISRTSFNWGIPFPLDKKHITYVWFDALFSYLSGSGKNQKYWPASVHLLGKDNGWFHSVYWPAFLKSAGYDMPKTVFIHGFLTFNGQKISKSLGNVISPKYLAEKYGADSLRYFICRNFVFGEDGDFSEDLLIQRHNNELANKFGNLISRVSTLAEKYGIKKTKNNLIKKLKLKQIEAHFENYEIDKVLNEIFAFIDVCNEYVQSKKPWETGNKKILYELADSIKTITILLYPFMPASCDKVAEQFSFKVDFKEIKKSLKTSKIKKCEILFKKIEFQKSEIKQEQKVNKHKKIEGVMDTKMIEYEDVQNARKKGILEQPKNLNSAKLDFSDWAKLDLRVGEIEHVEDVKGADKLFKLTINIGKENRIVCAGLKQFYSHEDLKGRKCILFTNLKPRILKGIESQGMILAAVNENQSKVVLIEPESDIEVGSKIM